MNSDANVLEWFSKLDWSSPRPQFVAIHLMSVHAFGKRLPQYQHWQPSKFSLTSLVKSTTAAQVYGNNYLNGVLQADDIIRQIFEMLRKSDILKNALLIVTADHGEALGEHGPLGHGHAPFEVEVRIPLLVYDPEAGTYPKRELPSQMDIAPTILSAIGAPIPSTWQGVPLQQPLERSALSVASADEAGIIAGHKWQAL